VAKLALRGLSKRFGGGARGVLRDLTLEVADGELLVVLGPAACGKTTLCRCIAGLERGDTGEILVGERDVTRLPPGERNVALVFHTHALYPHLTAGENLAFPLRTRRLSRDEIRRRVAETASRLTLTPLLERRPGQLSAAERWRVALGRAVIRTPHLIVCDEPLSQLDGDERAAARAELAALQRALGTTLLYATRDPVGAMTLGHRIAVLQDGELRQLGTPAEVYKRPNHVFVAQLLGAPGMNILHGTAVERRGETSVDCGGFVVPVTLSDYAGQVHLGVRPEHVAMCGADQGQGNALVRAVQPLGAETFVHLDAGGQTLVARLAGLADVRVGDRVGFKLDRQHLHLFDFAQARLA